MAFIKHGSPEPIKFIIEADKNIDEIAKKSIDKLKENAMLDDPKKDKK